MAAHYIERPLQDGFVHNWLVAGPQAVAVAPSRELRHELLRQHATRKAGIKATPVERGPLDAGQFTIGNYTGSWTYYPCPEDHTIDHSGFYASLHLLRSWAYIELVSEREQQVTLAVTAHGVANVWAADKQILQAEASYDRRGDEGMATHAVPLKLGKGVTPLLVSFGKVGMGDVAHAMRLRVCDGSGARAAEGVHVRFRTLIEQVGRRNAFEQLSAAAFVERDVYAGETPIVLRWPTSPRANCFAHVRLQTADGRIYLAGDSAGAPGEKLPMGNALQLPAGPLQATLMPTPNEVYLEHLRIARAIPLWSLGKQRYHPTTWRDMAGRRNELLLAASRDNAPLTTMRGEDSLFAQIARMAWGAWAEVDGKAILAAIQRVQRREVGSNLLLLALLGMTYRWGEHASFPAEVRQPLEASILGFRYGDHDADSEVMELHGEATALLFQACELLAGQLYPQRAFGDGQAGGWHRARAEEEIKQWIANFGAFGSAAWNSPASIEQEIVALVHLCDFAEAQDVFEMATVALDKMIFTLALHSWHGVWGVAHQRGSASMVKSGLLQPSAPICNLLWGMGIFNQHLAGAVSLACSTNYEMPILFARLAAEIPEALWSREQHAFMEAKGEKQRVNLVTYKTPDYMLSSVQDYRPGQTGQEEAVWRVTLGAEAVVFATHPGSSSESDSRVPGFWAGNGRLPRVAQWKETLVAIHRLEDDDLFGFTHAYFPTAAFDDYVMRHGWIFGRRGDGYVALTNSQPIALTQEGRYALRELRAEGRSQSWLVQMGRAAVDGDFATFQAKVLALPLRFGDGTLEFGTLRGEQIAFGWEGPLRVNGENVPLDNFPHLENAYTVTELGSGAMEIEWAGDGLRLEFGSSS